MPVKLEHTNYIDAFFPDTKVIVEQKSLQKNLSEKILQSDKNFLTPYEQAQKYILGLPLSMHPRFIVVCNFQEFLIYDMEYKVGRVGEKITRLRLPHRQNKK